MRTNIYIACAPDEIEAADRLGAIPLVFGYTLAGDGLYVHGCQADLRGAVACVSGDQGDGGAFRADIFGRELAEMCLGENMRGAFLDFPDSRAYLQAAAEAEKQFARSHLQLFVTPPLGDRAAQSCVCLPLAPCRGRFDDELSAAYRAKRAVFLQTVCMQFPLSQTRGSADTRAAGDPLSHEELDDLLRRHNPTVYFSNELMANYFTFTHKNRCYFVVFDDARSLRRKLDAVIAKRIEHLFMAHAEVCGIGLGCISEGHDRPVG